MTDKTLMQLKWTNYNEKPETEDHHLEDHHLDSDHEKDFKEYHFLLNRIQNASLFNWGIVKGLEVTIQNTDLQVNPGVAIDRDGKLIALCKGSEADIGYNPKASHAQNNIVPVPVTLKTAGSQGDMYVTIEDSTYKFSRECKQIPWVRLQKVSPGIKDNGIALILATVTIDNGKITAHGNDRKLIETNLGKITFRRGAESIVSPIQIGDKVQGEISALLPSEGSGLKISVPEAGDSSLFFGKDASGLEKLEVKTDSFVVKDSKNRETLKTDTKNSNLVVDVDSFVVKNSQKGEILTVDTKDAKLYVGAKGNDGDLFVKDSADRNVIHLNGYKAKLYLGNEGKAGKLSVFDTTGNESVIVSGDTGNLSVSGAITAKELDVQGDIKLNGKNAFKGDYYLRINQDNAFPGGAHFNYRTNFYRGITTGDWWDVEPGVGNLLVKGRVGVGTTSPEDTFQVGIGIERLVIGSAVGQALAYGSSYIGFNAARTKSGWKFNTDTSSNGGSVIYSTPYGALVFVAIPSNNATNGDQILNDADVFSNRKLVIHEDGKIDFSNGKLVIHKDGKIEYFGTLTKGSSRDLKENIHDLSIKEAFEILESLNPVKFVMKNDKERTLQAGFIAEESPDLAATADRKGIVNDNIIAVLTKVIKEQQKTIAELIDDVNALKNNKSSVIS